MASKRGGAGGRGGAQSGGAQKPWRLRFSPRIIAEDLDEIGHAAFEGAQDTIRKKLKVAPDQYGGPLRTPLAGMRKLTVSHVRIVYRVFDDLHEVRVYMMGARRDIWDHDQPAILERATEMQRIAAAEQAAAAKRASESGRERSRHRKPKGRTGQRGGD